MDTLNSTPTDTTAAVAQPRPLTDFLPGGQAEHPVVRLTSGHDIVLLGRVDQHYIQFAPATTGRPGMTSPTATATPITDPQRQNILLRQALAALSADHETLRIRHAEDSSKHRATLDEIRGYAITKHRERQICRDGLDDFLSEFDMDAYHPKTKVTFTIHGSFIAETDDTHNASNDAHHNLRVDFDGLDLTTATTSTSLSMTPN